MAHQEPAALQTLVSGIELITDPDVEIGEKIDILEELSEIVQPQQRSRESRQDLVKVAAQKGAASAAVSCVELGVDDLTEAAAVFMANLAFDSIEGALAVLGVFDRAVAHFGLLLNGALTQVDLVRVNTLILLCANVAVACPSSHSRLLPLVRPVCMRVISQTPSAVVDDKLRGDTILLLANLSLTVSAELRALGVSEVLLDTIVNSRVTPVGKSVAESVVVFLHAGQRCTEIDRLMEVGFIGRYCVPLMERTLRGEQFRGMFPALTYSARLFWMLARTPEYARALAANRRAAQLLLQATRAQEAALVAQDDLEGRLLALEALRELRRLHLWPPCGKAKDAGIRTFLRKEVPALMQSRSLGIRAAAADIWALSNEDSVHALLMLGQQLHSQKNLPATLWRHRVLTALYPCLGCEEAAVGAC